MSHRSGRLRDRLAAVLLLGAGCARPAAPPGGEPDRMPPQVIAVRPEPGSVVERWNGSVVFRFDERISERGIEQAVLVSPETGEVRLDKGRSHLEVSLDGGWRTGQVYRVVLLPVVRDLFGNTRRDPFELVFSTGPPIPETALAGEVVDRLTLQPLQGARIEAVHRADSVIHVAVTDSAGFYAMRQIPQGVYELRAYHDRNRNRRPDGAEPRAADTATLGAADTVFASFALLAPDTTPARLLRAVAEDTTHVRLSFDDHFDPSAPLTGVVRGMWRLPDSSAVQLGELLHAHVWEERAAALAEARRRAAAADSAAEAGADTAAVPADALVPPGNAGLAADTGTTPLPTRDLVLVSAEPLAWETEYLVAVDGVANIAGVPGGGGTAVFETPAAPPPPDTLEQAAADTLDGAVPPDTVP